MSRLIWLLIVGCGGEQASPKSAGSETDATDGLLLSVDDAGPYQAGYRSWDVIYDPGLGEGERTVRMNLWYPTEATSGTLAVYTVGASEGDAFEDAELAPSAYGGSYPVHAHSHGHQGWGATSAFLPVHLASHGWITVAPDHTDNTLLDNVDPRPTDIYIHRPLDISAVLDALESDAILGEQADTTAVLLSGHSFGTITTWASGGAALDVDSIMARCESTELPCTEAERAALSSERADPRIAALIPLAGSYDPDWFGAEGYQSVQGPVLHMGGTMDDRGQAEQYEALTGIDYAWLELQGGCHTSFSLGACSTLETQLGYHLIQTYALAFGRAHILGDDDPTVTGLLDGSLTLAPEGVYRGP